MELKISLLDKIAFSSEQDCKRKHQQIQELIDHKDKIEKLIANILNGDRYSKIKQIAKESVKAVLSDNKPFKSIDKWDINTAVASSSSNLILLLPQSSSTFPRPLIKAIPTEQQSQKVFIIIKSILLIDLE